MKKSNEISRRQYSDRRQSEFSHRWSCWASNHNGWAKMKSDNRKLFKKKYRQEIKNQIKNEQEDIINANS